MIGISKKISCIIPFIHEYPAIYMTINNFQSEMKDSKYKWEIVAAENGTEDINTEHAFTGSLGSNPLYSVPMRMGLIKYVFEPRQCGPIARNSGAKESDGDFLFFCDGHTTFGKGTIDIMADYLTDHPEVGCVIGLTAKSHFDKLRMGGHYEIFHEDLEKIKKGGPTIFTHMHGSYMTAGRVAGWAGLDPGKPYPCVMGSQAYTMYRRDEFWKLGGYLETCRFYPHPEGYMPFKVLMSGKEVHIHPDSWHLHGNWPRTYAASGPERRKKLREYSIMQSDGMPLELSWQEHGWRNVLMVAYVLGELKWLNLCENALNFKHGNPRTMSSIKESAIELATPIRESLEDRFEKTIDEVLIESRKNKLPGMENWDSRMGPDPLG